MEQRLTIISSDGHCGPRVAGFRDYVEARYLDDFDDYVANNAGGTHEDHMLEDEMAKRWKREMVELGGEAALWDPKRRVEGLESEGVVAEIVYPDGSRQNQVPFTGMFGVGRSKYSLELRLAGQRAYNRWVAEYCETYPERLGGLAVLQLEDIDEAVKEVEWAGSHAGIRGVLVPGVDPKLPPYFSSRLDPLWAACSEADLPINVHVGAGGDERGLGENMSEEMKAAAAGDGSAAIMITIAELAFFAHRPLWFLICGGVLDRFPTLKVVFTEQYADWIPRTIEYLDWVYQRTPFRGVRSIEHTPSTYWKRQCFVGASVPSRAEAALRREIGIENMMYGTDYPHYEGTWGRTREMLRATFGETGTTPDEARKIFAENAARCYGFDLEVLDEVAGRVGPRIDEILAPSDIDLGEPQYAMVSRPLSL